MSLKSIKSNYIKFLQVLKDEGMQINESQKEVLDNFMGSIENTISQTRDDAIRTTKRLVEEKMEKEYKQVFESILSHKQEHTDISEKIQKAVNESKEIEPLVDTIDRYLENYVEQILPKKEIVDYERLEKLERIQESLKDLLQAREIVTEDTKEEDTAKAAVKAEEDVIDAKKKALNANEAAVKAKKEVLGDKKEETEETTNTKKSKNPQEQEAPETPEQANESCDGCVKTVDQELTEVLEDGKTEAETERIPAEGEETPTETSPTEGEVEGEENLEEALARILETKKSESTETSDKKICSKDAEGTEIIPETAEGENNEEDLFENVRIDDSQMQQWIDAIYRTTPQK